MEQKFVKKLGRLMEKYGITEHDYQFVTVMEDRITKLRAEADDPNDLQFELDFHYPNCTLLVHGEVVEDIRETNGEEHTFYPVRYECLEFRFNNGKPPVFEEFEYTEYY